MGFLSENTERVLRIITMWAVLPGWPMLLGAAIQTSKNWYPVGGHPAGTIPAFLSTIPFALTLMSGISFLWLHSKISWLAFLLSDVFIALFYFALLLPIWIVEPHRLNQAGDFVMLETYGSSFMLLNMTLHGLLFASGFRFSWRRCEHCGTRMFHRKAVQLPPSPPVSEREGARYSLLGERQSYDAGEDETAALIPSNHDEEAAGPSEGKGADHHV